MAKKTHGVFTNSLWYLEFFASMIFLILFLYLLFYLAGKNHISYYPKLDKRKHHHKTLQEPVQKAVVIRPPEPCQRPVCFESSCIWFCRLAFSIITIGFCYYFGYFLLRDTKLKLGLFMNT